MTSKTYINEKLLSPPDSKIVNPFLKSRGNNKKYQTNAKTIPRRSSKTSSGTPTPTPPPRSKKGSMFSFLNIWFFLPFIVCGFMSTLFYFLVLNKNQKNTVFCGGSIQENCLSCPNNAICQNGQMKCEDGFINSENLCIFDEKQTIETTKLYHRMAEYVASQVNADCKQSRSVYREELKAKFGNSEYFERAINLLEENGDYSEFNIILSQDLFISFSPILNAQCKVQLYARENFFTAILLGIFCVLCIVLVVSINKRKREQKEVQKYSKSIVRQLKNSQKGEFKYVSDFQVLDTNPIFKYWNDIVDEIERNPSIATLNGTRGKMWSFL